MYDSVDTLVETKITCGTFFWLNPCPFISHVKELCGCLTAVIVTLFQLPLKMFDLASLDPGQKDSKISAVTETEQSNSDLTALL